MKSIAVITHDFACEFCDRVYKAYGYEKTAREECERHEQHHRDVRIHNAWVKVGDTIWKPTLDYGPKTGVVLRIENGGETFLVEHPDDETRYRFYGWVFDTYGNANKNTHKWDS